MASSKKRVAPDETSCVGFLDYGKERYPNSDTGGTRRVLLSKAICEFVFELVNT